MEKDKDRVKDGRRRTLRISISTSVNELFPYRVEQLDNSFCFK